VKTIHVKIMWECSTH